MPLKAAQHGGVAYGAKWNRRHRKRSRRRVCYIKIKRARYIVVYVNKTVQSTPKGIILYSNYRNVTISIKTNIILILNQKKAKIARDAHVK